jgi:transposase InsO family protein
VALHRPLESGATAPRAAMQINGRSARVAGLSSSRRPIRYASIRRPHVRRPRRCRGQRSDRPTTTRAVHSEAARLARLRRATRIASFRSHRLERPDFPAIGILHSDRGSQFRARKQQRALTRHRMVGSMCQVGSAGDNAAMKSFFALLPRNVFDRRRWHSRDKLRIADGWRTTTFVVDDPSWVAIAKVVDVDDHAGRQLAAAVRRRRRVRTLSRRAALP